MAVEMRDSRSITELLGDVLRDSRDLVRTEGNLVRAEISEKFATLQIAGVAFVGAIVCFLVALGVLTQALVIALSKYMDPAWAAVIIGLAFAVIGAIFLAKARKNMKPANLTPHRSVDQLRKDSNLVKEHAR